MSTTAAITNACATIPVQAAPEISTPEVLLPEGYTMLRKLGSGAFATVYKAQRESDGQVSTCSCNDDLYSILM
jgi:serine/threonine protein kinase